MTRPDPLCTEHEDCQSFGNCSSLSDLIDDCDVINDRRIYRSSCGGTYVEDSGGVTATDWIFDEDGKQIGGSYEDESSCSSWGPVCGPQGTGEPLCDWARCTQHDSCGNWGASFGCPSDVNHIAELCSLGISEASRSPSDCGGTIVGVSNGIQLVIYDFDGTGKLSGVMSQGDAGGCDRWGTHCAPIGEAEVLCGGEGGAGGEGGGGAGGAAGGVGGDGG